MRRHFNKVIYFQEYIQIGQNIYYDKDIRNLYITQNLDKTTLSHKLNISLSQCSNILLFFKIKKSTSLINANRIKKVQQKYGVENISQLSLVKSKKKNSSLHKYGVENISQSSLIKEKKKKKSIQKYGKPYFFQTLEFKNIMKVKWQGKSIGNLHLSTETINILNSKDNFIHFLSTNQKHNKKISVMQAAKLLKCSNASILHKVHEYSCENLIDLEVHQSSSELEVLEFMQTNIPFPIIERCRDVLPNHYEIDIYCPIKKIGIEFNGTYWHSNINKNKEYHFIKSRLAEEKGIHLIHIYEYEWNDPVKQKIIKSLLQIAFGIIPQKIYARKCKIKVISNHEASLFNASNHLQGHRNAQITYGLFYKEKLVQLMSFSKTRYNKNIRNDDTWEIIRGCPGSNNIVIGGVSRLFQHFQKDYHPKSVFSYCDFNKFTGKSYEAIGMKFIGYTGPDMKWVMSDFSVINRNPHMHKKLKQQSIACIWGAGSKKYVWTLNEKK